MRKLLCVLTVLVLVLSLGSISVFAKDGDLLIMYEGADLTGKNNGDDQGGVRNPEKGTIELGRDPDKSGHGLWGYEPDAYDTAGGTKTFTMVVVAKIVQAGDDTDDNVLRMDHKIRPQDGTPEPEDQGAYYTGEDLAALKADANGYVTLYSVITPDVYDSASSIKIENRIHFNSTLGWEIDIYKLALYEGDVSSKEVPEPNPDKTTAPAGPSATKKPSQPGTSPQTGDAGILLAMAAAGAAVVGGLKLRRK